MVRYGKGYTAPPECVKCIGNLYACPGWKESEKWHKVYENLPGVAARKEWLESNSMPEVDMEWSKVELKEDNLFHCKNGHKFLYGNDRGILGTRIYFVD